MFARMVADFQDAKHYLALGYNGIDAWMDSEHYPRATIKRWVGLARKHAALPPETLSRISRLNAGTLLKLPEAKRYEPSILEAAESQNNDQFKITVQKRFGNLHLDNKVQLSWWVPEKVAMKIDEALELAKSIHETESDIEVLEYIFHEYVERHEGEA